jgi:hypothetical protein
MPVTIFGLPAHILLVHAVVVLVPLTCIAVVLHAVWPVARRRLGVVTPLLGLVCLVLMPVTINAGNWLRARLHASGTLARNVNHHASLGNGFWPWVAGLFVVSCAVWVVGRMQDGTPVRLGRPAAPRLDRAPSRDPLDRPAPPVAAVRALARPVVVAVAVVAVAVAGVTLVEVYRVGESGSHSVWCSGKSAYCPSGG